MVRLLAGAVGAAEGGAVEVVAELREEKEEKKKKKL